MGRVQLIMAAFLFAFLTAGTAAVIIETKDILSSIEKNKDQNSYVFDGSFQTLEVIPATSAESRVPDKLIQQLTPSGTTFITGTLTSVPSTDS